MHRDTRIERGHRLALNAVPLPTPFDKWHVMRDVVFDIILGIRFVGEKDSDGID
jgi:hypothetical protein